MPGLSLGASAHAAQVVYKGYYDAHKDTCLLTDVSARESGEKDYNPLREELFVTWKAGVTPTLLTSDDEINAPAKAGKLSVRDTHVVRTGRVGGAGARALRGFASRLGWRVNLDPLRFLP